MGRNGHGPSRTVSSPAAHLAVGRNATLGLSLVLVASAACVDGMIPDGGIDADALPVLALEEELRLGSLEDPEDGFSRIGGVHVAPDGRMFVMEAQDRQIRVYDPDGRLIRRIGAQGQGPGEFMAPGAFGLVGDTLWAHDFRNQRITLFTPDGALIGTIPAEGVRLSAPVPNVLSVQIYPARLRPDGRYESSPI